MEMYFNTRTVISSTYSVLVIILIFMVFNVCVWVSNSLVSRVTSGHFIMETLSGHRNNDRHMENIHVMRANTSLKSRSVTIYPKTDSLNFTLNNPEVCKGNIRDSVDGVSVLFLVHSAPEHFKNRENIRSTFTNQSYFKLHTVRVIFIVGKSKFKIQNTKLAAEHRKYGDVIQGDFRDSYHNLTLKAVAGFHWITKYCPDVKVVAKIDDDTFVNTVMLLQTYLPFLVKRRKSLICHRLPFMKVNARGIWTAMEIATTLRYYPTYPWHHCSGYGVFVRGDLIGPLCKAATITPLLWVDDVYVTGMLTSRINGVTFKHAPNRMLNHCFHKRNCNMLYGNVPVNDIPRIWKYIFTVRYQNPYV